MRTQEIRGHSVLLSHHAGVVVVTGGLSTSLVMVLTDAVHDGRRAVGYGHASTGRYTWGGLIHKYFAPRLLEAPADSLMSDDGSGIDPLRAWDLMMRDEKPGGHSERYIAVGALDIALWDAAAKATSLPLHRLLARCLELVEDYLQHVPVYAGGGYPYLHDNPGRLEEELRRFADLGYTHAKIKVGAAGLGRNRCRIDRALWVLDDASWLAVDVMNRYDTGGAVDAAKALASLRLWRFEDICDPHDFPTQVEVTDIYPNPIGAGEVLFSLAEVRLLGLYSGLRRERNALIFDPVHYYGLPNYLAMLDHLCARGWPRAAFCPYADCLFSLYLVVALCLGWAEITPSVFRPLDDFANVLPFSSGLVGLSQSPDIGFEHQATLAGLSRKLLEVQRTAVGWGYVEALRKSARGRLFWGGVGLLLINRTCLRSSTLTSRGLVKEVLS